MWLWNLLTSGLLLTALATPSLASDNFDCVSLTGERKIQWENEAEYWRAKWIKEFIGKDIGNYPVKVQLTIDFNGKGDGNTTYVYDETGKVTSFTMKVSGRGEKLQKDVLPHEVMHTVMAVYMGDITPRWADEGYATFIEQTKDQYRLRHVDNFKMVMNADDYPKDALNFYAQSTLMVEFLVQKKDVHTFRDFIYEFKHTQGDWPIYLKKYYGYEGYEDFQRDWQKWYSNRGRIIDVSN